MASSSELPCRVAGSMLKRGHVRKNWKKRFFQLDLGSQNSDPLLKYYADSNYTDKKGEVKLLKASIEPVNAPLTPGSTPMVPMSPVGGSSDGLGLKLAIQKGGKKTYLLECSCVQERNEWLRILRGVAAGEIKGRRDILDPTKGADLQVLCFSDSDASGSIRVDAFLALAQVGGGGGNGSPQGGAAAVGGQAGPTASASRLVRVASSGSFTRFSTAAGASPELLGETFDPESIRRIAKTGFLGKKGQINPQWQKRWFTLSDAETTDTIRYYKHAGGLDLKGEIVLDPRHTEVTEQPSGSYPYAFAIATVTRDGSHKRIFLNADTSEERDGWLDAIKRALSSSVQEERDSRQGSGVR